MTRLIAALIRHGDYHQLTDTPSAHQPFPLNDRGKQQAASAAHDLRRQLHEQRWELYHEIDCSGLLRAWQTADIFRQTLSDCFQQPALLKETQQLAERGLGIAGNLSIRQIESLLMEDPRYKSPPADWKSDSHYCLPYPGAESLMMAGERVAHHLETRMAALATAVCGDTLQLFVGHGAAFRHGAHQLGVLEFGQIARLSMFHAEPVYLEYHGPGRWTHIAGDWKIRGSGSDYKD